MAASASVKSSNRLSTCMYNPVEYSNREQILGSPTNETADPSWAKMKEDSGPMLQVAFPDPASADSSAADQQGHAAAETGWQLSSRAVPV